MYLKALKTGCFTVSVSSSFLFPSSVFSGEKQGNWQGFLYMGSVGEGEGKEEGSDTFKALKTKGFTISVSSSFLSLFDSLSGEKKGIGRAFYMWGV